MAFDINKMNEKREQLAERLAGGGDFEFYEIKDGSQIIRVLPPKGDKDIFWKEAVLHFNVGGTGVVACLKQFGKKCPVCDEIAKLKKSKSKEDQTTANKMRASNRVYMNIIERGNKDKVDVPQILNCGGTVLKAVLDIVCDPEYGDVTDFTSGFDLTLTRSGKKLDTKYALVPKRNPSQATVELSEENLQEALADLDTLVVEKSKDEVLGILNGDDSDDTQIDDEPNTADTDDDDASGDDDDIEAQIRAEIEKAKGKKK